MTTVLLAIALATTLAAIVLHVAVVVHAFQRSVPWGVLALLVPFASVVYAFTRFEVRRRSLWAGLLLGFFLAAGACWLAASMLTAEAYFGTKTKAAGMNEFDKQVQSLDNIQDLQLPARPDGKK
ncbi:MAG: hypothetical protein PHU25_12800 [Deltaproteobacteria bacterium]|nr:hypothetical protein [Deltaproteobacteria bacterium]